MIKAIETRYKGYRFRSRLEARWAVFFDAMGVNWDYEPEGFKLSNGKNYLPDFYLPDYDFWIEIKGKKASEKETDKCVQLFSDLGGKIDATDLVALGDMKVTWDIFGKVVDMLGESPTLEQRQSLISEITDAARKKVKVYLFEGLLDSGWFATGAGCVQIHVPNALWFLFGGKKDNVYHAFTCARSARFEHGETPV